MSNRPFEENEHHDALLDWWDKRNVTRASVLHVDFHADLGSETEATSRDPGNFLAIAAAEGRISSLYWIVPFDRRTLSQGVAAQFVRTLPPACLENARETAPGRWSARFLETDVFLRGCDDLPTGTGDMEVSFDLDFFYCADMGGPTLDAVAWMNQFCEWRGKINRGATFLSWSLADGYAPPTYRPVASWLGSTLRTGKVGRGGRNLWKRVMDAERRRLGARPAASVRPASAGTPEHRFWATWQAYMAHDWTQVAAELSRMEPVLRFRPIEELLVEYQARRIAPASVRRRVRLALKSLPDCHGVNEQAAALDSRPGS